MPQILDDQQAVIEPPAAAFAWLARRWRAERPHGCDVRQLTDTPAYRQIIGLGEPVLPALLAELAREVDHWFPALRAITGENPVPPASAGKLPLMAAAWIEWGRARGYVGRVD